MADKKLSVTITGNAKSAQKAFRDLDSATAKSAKKSKASLGTMASGLVGVGLAAGAWKAFDGWNESQKILAQTEAVIRSTGAAANVTAGQVNEMAVAISKQTGIHDEAIQTGQNLLLTFTKIQNQAGEGNDIFDQATQIMVDMSVAMGTDAKTSAIQLGKALNDPTVGMTALTRSGITFTNSQKEQVKALQESGDMLGAQKVILAELTTQFEGSAAAQATSLDRAKVSISNMSDEVVGVLAPALEAAASGVGTVTQGFSEMPQAAQNAVVGVAAFAALGPKVYGVGVSAVASAKRFGEASSRIAKSLVVPTRAIDGLGNVTGDATGASGKLATTLPKVAKGAGVAGVAVAALAFLYVNMTEESRKAKKGAQELADEAEAAGQSLEEAFTDKLAKTIAGVTGGFDLAGSGGDLGANMDALGVSAKQLAEAVTGTDDQFEAFLQTLRDTDSVGTRNEEAFNALVQDTHTLRNASRQASGTQSELTTTQAQLGIVTDDTAEATGEAAEATAAAEQEAKDYADAIQTAKDALSDYLGLMIETEASELQFRETLMAGTMALAENGRTLDGHTATGIENRTTIQGMAEEVNRLTQAKMDETGSAEQAAEAHRINTLRYQDALIQAGYTKEEVAALTTEYLKTPSDIETYMNVQTAAAELKLGDVTTRYENVKASLSNPIYMDIITRYQDIDARAGEGPAPQRRAVGGPISAGTPYIVGEEGPELVIPKAAGTVVPAGPTAAMMGRRGGMAPVTSGGGTHITVNVAGTVTAERDLVDVITRAQLQDTRQYQGLNRYTPWTT